MTVSFTLGFILEIDEISNTSLKSDDYSRV